MLWNMDTDTRRIRNGHWDTKNPRKIGNGTHEYKYAPFHTCVHI